MRGIRRFGHQAQEWLRKKLNRNTLLFGVFFLLSLLMWMFQTFGYSYSTKVSIPIVYNEVPTDIAVSPDLPKTLEVEIRDNGFALFSFEVSGVASPIVLPVDIREERNGHLEWDMDYLENEVLKKLSQTSRTFKILSIIPSLIATDYSPKAKKEVPIHLTNQIVPAPGYLLTEVTLSPEEVIVYGNKAALDSLTIIPTDTTTITNVTDTQTLKVELKAPHGITLTPPTTTLHISTEKLVQKVFTLPIAIPEVSPKYNLRIFPTSIQVTCVVPASKQEELKASDIHAMVSAKNVANSAKGALKVIIDEYPDYVQMIQSDPGEAEYLLEKK